MTHEKDMKVESPGRCFHRLWYMEEPDDLQDRLGIQPLLAAYVENSPRVSVDTGMRQWPFWSITVLFHGEMEFHLGGGRKRRLRPGEAFLHFPGSTHRQSHGTPCRQGWVHFKGKLPDEARLSGLLDPGTSFFDVSRPRKLEEDMLRIFTAADDRREKKRDLAAFVYGVLSDILEVSRQKSRSRRPGSVAVQKALGEMEACFESGRPFPPRLPMEGLAVDKEVFLKEFRIRTGKTPAKYLEGMKIDAIKRDLYRSRLSIKEIAAKYGFYDTFHLSHRFKKLTGINPVAYRKMMETEGG